MFAVAISPWRYCVLCFYTSIIGSLLGGGWTLAFACVGGLAFMEGCDGMKWIGMDWEDTMASIGILSGAFRAHVIIICLLF
jgi:hypothetical protein